MDSVRNVVFDFGDVLIRFRWRELCRELNFTNDVTEMISSMIVSSSYWHELDAGNATLEDACRHFEKAVPGHEEQVRAFWNCKPRFAQEYDYTPVMIRTLKERGYHLFVLSNYEENLFRMHWESVSVRDLFNGYLISSPLRITKPDRRFYLKLCEKYCLKPEECLFLDDKKENTNGAKNAGMKAKVFTGPKTARWLIENLRGPEERTGRC